MMVLNVQREFRIFFREVNINRKVENVPHSLFESPYRKRLTINSHFRLVNIHNGNSGHYPLKDTEHYSAAVLQNFVLYIHSVYSMYQHD